MKTLLLALVLSACITRTVVAPQAPAPQLLYHVAEDNLLASANGSGAKCERIYATPSYDSARCTFKSGAVVYGWNSTTTGFGFTVLTAPTPPVEEKKPEPTPAAPPVVPAKAEAPKKK